MKTNSAKLIVCLTASQTTFGSTVFLCTKILAKLNLRMIFYIHVHTTFAQILTISAQFTSQFLLQFSHLFSTIFWGTSKWSVGISPICNFAAVGPKDKLTRSKGQRSRSQRDHMWTNKQFGRRFLDYLQNAWTYFNKTYHSYSLPGPEPAQTTCEIPDWECPWG